MQADKTTRSDLSIFNHEEELSVFHHIDFTGTIGGKDYLKELLSHPLSSLKDITETQQTIKKIQSVDSRWPERISNGTIMVMQRFYETALDDIPAHPNMLSSLYYKIISSSDYGIIRFSVIHFVDFIKGLYELINLLSAKDNPQLLQNMIDRINQLQERQAIKNIIEIENSKTLSPEQSLQIGHYMKNHFKQQLLEMIDIYSKLDAYYSMAKACKEYKFSFPSFSIDADPFVTSKQLYHLLLQSPVSYDVSLTQQQNFLFLTGANMGGKSTFIKAVGVAVYLAHIGMGVPAEEMQLTLFDGLLSNIQVADNIIKGESYFFNEVQRIRKTIEKISDGKKWLILIDELFKGTNVQDAMKCSTTVVEGLRKMKNALFVLSTHLYEIGEGLKKYSNIQFRYFETEVRDEQLYFSYQLKEGISNDRLGYLILKREGVVDMLEKL